MSDTCILVTAFLRDDLTQRCVESIRRFYPDIDIFIGHNGHADQQAALRPFCKRTCSTLVRHPFDLGVGGVRNATLEQIPAQFRYIFVCEDDILFTEETVIEKLRQVLDAEPTIGLAGGHLLQPGVGERHYEAMMKIQDDNFYVTKLIRPEWLAAGATGKPSIRFCKCDLILNVFLMRREAWESNPWDAQFKTALEHCDFFWSLKTRTKWRVAYVPEVTATHDHGKDADRKEYDHYRNRPKGWRLFGQKWGVWQSWNDWNATNPISFFDMEERVEIDPKDPILATAIEILNRHGVKWWLEAGTCLGVFRDRKLMPWDPDIDIGIAPENSKSWDALKKDFIAAGFEHYKDWRRGPRVLEVSFWKNAGGDRIKFDLFFFGVRGDMWWHGAWGPEQAGKENRDFLPHVFSAELFKELEPVTYRGMEVYLPAPTEKYLAERYGKDWRTPDREYKYWLDCEAIDKNFLKDNRTVFVGGVWDLFHAGHLNILRNCRRLGRVVVGVLTDEAAARYKAKPIIPFAERKEIVASLDLVDEVITQNDKNPIQDFQKLDIHPDYLVHGDDWDACPGAEFVETFGGKVVFFPYTRGISSSSIRGRILNNAALMKESQKSVEPNAWAGKIAIAIKTFMREPVLMRALDTIEKNCPLPYKIYIADDGPTPSDAKAYRYAKLMEQGHAVIRLPFNSGISAGRNAMVKAITEDYVLMMDDDILIPPGDGLLKMKEVLDSDSKLGVVAALLGLENSLELYGGKTYANGLRFERNGALLLRVSAGGAVSETGGVLFKYADQVPNFFLAKRQVFDSVRWDDKILVEWEHMDFFLRLKEAGWKAAVCVDVRAVHQRSEPTYEYEGYRRAGVPSYFLQKHGLEKVINQYA